MSKKRWIILIFSVIVAVCFFVFMQLSQRYITLEDSRESFVVMNRIKELRLEMDWLQSDLAEKLNTKPQSVSRYETEQRQLDPDTIHKLCNIFNCTADYLLGRSEVKSFELSGEEAQLLEGFRALSAPGREYLLHTLALAQLAHAEKNGAVSDVEISK